MLHYLLLGAGRVGMLLKVVVAFLLLLLLLLQVAKVSDFGVSARLLDGATHRSTTSLGTITHMAYVAHIQTHRYALHATLAASSVARPERSLRLRTSHGVQPCLLQCVAAACAYMIQPMPAWQLLKLPVARLCSLLQAGGVAQWAAVQGRQCERHTWHALRPCSS